MTAPAAVPWGELIDKITILEIKQEQGFGKTFINLARSVHRIN
jgi:hypothetical protein